MIAALLPLLKSKLAAFGAVVIVCLAIAIAGPMILGSKWRLWCYLAALVVFLIFLLWLAVKAWRARKSARMLEGFMKQQADDQLRSAQADVQDELAAIKKKLERAVTVLKRSRLAKGRRGADALHVLPWYMIIGPSAAGKSTMLRNSGLSFPAVDAEEAEAGRVRGLGGTRNCDWWFSAEGIFLDTAGRYTISSGAPDDREEWTRFLDLLQRARKRAPINGLILAVAIDEVLKKDDDGLAAMAKTLRSRIDELTVKLQILFPVYVVFTKCDLISGFAEYCGDFGKPDREQIWGYTRRYEPTPGSIKDEFLREAGYMAAVLEHRRLRRLSTAVRPVERRGAYLFPIEFASAARRLGDFVEILFQPNPYQQTPMVRGFYFNSGTQEGTPVAQVMEAMRRDFGLSTGAVLGGSGEEEPKPYFIKDLFQRIILPDESKVRPLTSATRRRLWIRVGWLTLQAAGAGLLILAMFGSFFANRRFNKSLRSTTEFVATALPPAHTFNWQNLDTLDVLRDALETAERGPGLRRSFGLYSGEAVISAARDVYFRNFQDHVLRPLDARLKAKLRIPPAESEINQYFQTATVYRMITLHYDSVSHSAPELVEEADSIWSPEVTLDDQSRLTFLLDNNLRYYWKHRADTAQRWMRVPPDESLLAEVRRVMGDYWTLNRLYDRIVKDANGAVGYLTMIDIAPGNAHLLGGRIGGAFTRDGWASNVSKRIDNMPDEIDANPDLHEAFGSIEDDKIQEELTRRYVDEFRVVWRRFIDSVAVVPFVDLTDAASGLNALSQDNTPIVAILSRAWEESRLDIGGDGRRKIGDEFLPIGRFLGEIDLQEGSESGRSGYLKLIAELPKTVEEQRDLLQQQTKCALRLRALKTALTQRKRNIDQMTSGSALGRSVSDMLVRPLDAAQRAAYGDVCNCLNRVWTETVADNFQTSLAPFYPFNTSSETEATLADVAQFFGTSGIFTFDDAEGQPASNEGVTLSSDYRTALDAAKSIKSVIPGGRPSVVFNLTASTRGHSGIKWIRLEYGSDIYEFAMGPDKTKEFRWPKPGGEQVSLKVQAVDAGVYANPLRYTGEWALLRLMDAAKFDGSTCRWRFPTQAGPTLEVRYTVSGTGGDFIRNGGFSRFHCPSRVCP